jgi:hypothetical protein
MDVGGMPHTAFLHAIELLGTEVSPRVRSELGGEDSSCFYLPVGPRHDFVDAAACTCGVDVAAVDLDLRVVDEDGLLAGRACLAAGGGHGFGECLVGRVPGVA